MLTEPVLEGLLEVVGGATTAATTTDFLDAAPLALPAAAKASRERAAGRPTDCGIHAGHSSAGDGRAAIGARTLSEGPLGPHGLCHGCCAAEELGRGGADY